MRAVVQRVCDCSVTVGGAVSGKIGDGLLVYLGVCSGDDESDVEYLSDKTVNLRIFPDKDGKMNHSAVDLSKEVLVVSQFTLCADVRKGRRPSYAHAAEPVSAEALYRRYIESIKAYNLVVEEGVFGGMMEVSYTNLGPVTILLDSKRVF